MNKNCLLLVSMLVGTLSLVGCGKSDKPDKSSTSTPAAPVPVQYKMKWLKEEPMVESVGMTQNMVISIPGQPNPIKKNLTMGQEYGFQVLGDTSDGGHELEFNFQKVMMKSTVGEKTLVDYNSEAKALLAASSPMDDTLVSAFDKVVGNKIQFFMDASNSVVNVGGVDKLLKRLSLGTKADQLALMRAMFSEGYQQQMLSQYRFLPPQAVIPGDAWPIQMEFNLDKIGTLVVDFTFTVKCCETRQQRNCIRFDFEGTVDLKHGAPPNPSGMVVRIPKSSACGSCWFDPELGLMVETTINEDVNLVISLPLSPHAKPGGRMQTLTNEMTQALSVKLLSVR